MTRSQKTLNEKQNPKGEKERVEEALKRVIEEHPNLQSFNIVVLSKEQMEALQKVQQWLIECAEARPFN